MMGKRHTPLRTTRTSRSTRTASRNGHSIPPPPSGYGVSRPNTCGGRDRTDEELGQRR